MRMKKNWFVVFLLVFISGVLCAEDAEIHILTPVMDSEPDEIKSIVSAALEDGLQSAGIGSEQSQGTLRTWFSRQEGFYQVKITCQIGDIESSSYQRYAVDVNDVSALEKGIAEQVKEAVEDGQKKSAAAKETEKQKQLTADQKKEEGQQAQKAARKEKAEDFYHFFFPENWTKECHWKFGADAFTLSYQRVFTTGSNTFNFAVSDMSWTFMNPSILKFGFGFTTFDWQSKPKSISYLPDYFASENLSINTDDIDINSMKFSLFPVYVFIPLIDTDTLFFDVYAKYYWLTYFGGSTDDTWFYTHSEYSESEFGSTLKYYFDNPDSPSSSVIWGLATSVIFSREAINSCINNNESDADYKKKYDFSYMSPWFFRINLSLILTFKN
jgi:hypothetical protein